MDLDKLAQAVACAETSCGTRGAAVSRRNAHGLMRWSKNEDGSTTRYLATFSNMSQSYAEFKSVWRRLYGGRCPTIEDARRYTGHDKAEIWLGHVYSVYDCRS